MYVCDVRSQKWPICVSFGRLRVRDFPTLMNSNNGAESPLQVAEEEGLLERTRAVFFEDGVVGAELNSHGPRFESLFPHLINCPHATNLPAEIPKYDVIIRPDAFARLEELEDVTEIAVACDAGAAVQAVRNAGILQGLDSLMAISGATGVEVVLRIKRGEMAERPEGMMGYARSLLGLVGPKKSFTKLAVKGRSSDTNKVADVDLLHDKMVLEATFVTEDPKTRVIRCQKVFDAIEAGYEKHSGTIRKTAKGSI